MANVSSLLFAETIVLSPISLSTYLLLIKHLAYNQSFHTAAAVFQGDTHHVDTCI